jgi:hypothetical protein
MSFLSKIKNLDSIHVLEYYVENKVDISELSKDLQNLLDKAREKYFKMHTFHSTTKKWRYI